MMQITEITRTRKGRYSVFVDGEFLFALHEDVYLSHYSTLQPGRQVECEDLEEMRLESEERITKDRAFRLLGIKNYTGKQLCDKLRERTDPEIAEKVTARMAELGLINDREYAFACARDLQNLKHWSPRRIRQELCRRGIPGWLAEEAAAQFDEDGDEIFEDLVELTRRKYGRVLEDEKGRSRAFAGLARLGYDSGQIRAAIARVREEWDPEQ